jgi:hypothetical protein
MGSGQQREKLIQDTWGGAISARVMEVVLGHVVDWPQPYCQRPQDPRSA